MTIKLTSNDRRVLDAVQYACGEWDGYAPHGAGSWTGVRRLEARGLVAHDGYGVCCTCPDPHDGAIIILTDAGRALLESGL